MRSSTFVCAAASALLGAAIVHAAPGQDARPWSSRHAKRGGVDKLLLVSSPDEARAYATVKSQFVASANYGSKHSSLLPGVAVAPMIRVDDDIGDWTTRAEAAIKAGARLLQGPNEVNQKGLSGSAMASLWLRAIEPLLKKHPNVRGISPSVSSNPNFAAFFRSFLEACNGRCTLYCASAHIYGSPDRTVDASMDKLKSYLGQLQSAVGDLPLCITEFGNRATSSSAKADYIKAATSLLRAHPAVKLIAAFPHMDGGEFVSNGKLTKLGNVWVDA